MHNDSTVFIGLVVHKDSNAVARVGFAGGDLVIDVATIGTQQYAIDLMLAKLAGHGSLRFVYEAGRCGFWLQRYLTRKGRACMVAAPQQQTGPAITSNRANFSTGNVGRSRLTNQLFLSDHLPSRRLRR